MLKEIIGSANQICRQMLLCIHKVCLAPLCLLFERLFLRVGFQHLPAVLLSGFTRCSSFRRSLLFGQTIQGVELLLARVFPLGLLPLARFGFRALKAPGCQEETRGITDRPLSLLDRMDSFVERLGMCCVTCLAKYCSRV